MFITRAEAEDIIKSNITTPETPETPKVYYSGKITYNGNLSNCNDLMVNVGSISDFRVGQTSEFKIEEGKYIIIEIYRKENIGNTEFNMEIFSREGCNKIDKPYDVDEPDNRRKYFYIEPSQNYWHFSFNLIN